MTIHIPEHWRRISGLHVETDGTVGCVFMGHDMTTSILHVYDACKFATEVPAVIAQGICGRGRWIPMAWRKPDEAFAKQLFDAGVNTLPDPCTDTQAMAEVLSREIWQRLRASQLRVERSVAEWLDEYRSFYRHEGQVPLEGYPLMAATRHAMEMVEFARPQSMPGSKKLNYPKVAVI